MKTRQTVESRVSRVESVQNAALRVFHPRLWTLVPRPAAFTLVELLTVIAIIAVIAAFLLPLAGAVKRQAYVHTAQAEMSQLETAIESYKSAYGFYPPDSTEILNGIPINQLYYELVGTTNNGTDYVPLDGNTLDSISVVSMTGGEAFGANVGGFMNCNKPGADESAPHAQDFLPDLKPRQIAENITNANGVRLTLLVTSDGGPDPNYPLGIADANPWRYNYPGTNNPSSYDLWIQLKMSGKKYLICNWSKQVQINTSLP